MYINRYILKQKKITHTHWHRHADVNVYSPIITPAHMLASTNIYTFKRTHTFKHKHTNTHSDSPKGVDPYCTVFTKEQRAERGSFYEHKHHSKWFKEAPVQLPVKNHFGGQQDKKTSHSPATVGPLLLDTERSRKTLSEAHGRLRVLGERAEHQNKDEVEKH